MEYSFRRWNHFSIRVLAALPLLIFQVGSSEAREVVPHAHCFMVNVIAARTLSEVRPPIRRFVCLATFLPEMLVHRYGVCPGVSLCAARRGK